MRLSNLKQVILSTLQCVQDYDETYPITLYVSSENGAACTASFYSVVAPYQKSAGVMKCPSDTNALDVYAGLTSQGLPPCSAPKETELSYRYNFAVVDRGCPNPLYIKFGLCADPARAVKTLAGVEYSVETALVYDGRGTSPGGTAGLRPV